LALKDQEIIKNLIQHDFPHVKNLPEEREQEFKVSFQLDIFGEDKEKTPTYSKPTSKTLF
jgi:hypothetical protein